MPLLLVIATAAVPTATVARALPIAFIATMSIVVALCAIRYVQLQRQLLVQRGRELRELSTHLGIIEAEYRDGRARMHEINATIAGIAAATRILRTLPADHRDEFEGMIEAEIDRLMRLLDGNSDLEVETVAVDDVVEQLLTCHRARGRHVTWAPAGLHALGRRDDLAESLNVLLENAARHGNPADIQLTAHNNGGNVEISVSDGGAGVPPELRHQIFEWGFTRPDSPGQGIGLCVARGLVRGLDGDIHLDATASRTRFVMTLPAARTVGTTEPDLAMAG